MCMCIYVCICTWLLAIWEPSRGRNLGVLTSVCIYLLNFPFPQLDMISSRSGVLREKIKLLSSTRGGKGEPPVALNEGEKTWCHLLALQQIFSPQPPFILTFTLIFKGTATFWAFFGVCGIIWVCSLFFSCLLKNPSYLGLLNQIT